MNNNPFKNFKPLNPPSAKRKKPQASGDSFVEQLKSIGSSTVNSVKTDVVKGTAQTIFDQLLGSTATGQPPKQEGLDQSFYEDWIKGREDSAREEGRSEERALQAHHKGQEQVLFSFADESLKKEISDVRQELAMLVKTMSKVEATVEQAIMDNVVDAGVYHLNYFRKLKEWLKFMQKSMNDASAWLQMSTGRGKKSYYWAQSQKSGTKFSMSSEHSVARNAG